MATIIGREKEISELTGLYHSDRAQMIAVYGRRRVGKTFLIDEAMKGKITFRHAGLSPVDNNGNKNMLKEQLKHFHNSLKLHGMKKSKRPESWLDAFFMLEQHLESIDNGNRQVVFLDELPWMDTPRSGFITAFEGFWNTWGCHRDNLMVIVCGSANSWILDNLINSHGGLYNRTTFEIKLSPFTLRECEDYFISQGLRMSRYDIVQANMILGGIPYYMGYFSRGLSLAQNIDNLFFSRQPRLREEFDRLFASIFSNPEDVKKVVKVLGNRHYGYTRKEIIEKSGVQDGGGLTQILDALIAGDFIYKYVPYGKGRRDVHYKLMDPFCMFYLKFIQGKDTFDTDYWTNNQLSPTITSWKGFAFEELCFRHIAQIKRALGISGVVTSQSSWIAGGNENSGGTQIDMLIDRKDNVMNMCEMKFYSEEFTVNKAYHFTLMNRMNSLKETLPRKVSLHSTLVTTYGLTHNEYSGDFQQVITLDALF